MSTNILYFIRPFVLFICRISHVPRHRIEYGVLGSGEHCLFGLHLVDVIVDHFH